jgi:ADP-ribose pyrophosphatase YjhB (NUDIX family)
MSAEMCGDDQWKQVSKGYVFNEVGNLLVGIRAAHDPKRAGFKDFPGGGAELIDIDPERPYLGERLETPEETFMRETFRETGVILEEPDLFQVDEICTPSKSGGRNFITVYEAMVFSDEQDLNPDPGEFSAVGFEPPLEVLKTLQHLPQQRDFARFLAGRDEFASKMAKSPELAVFLPTSVLLEYVANVADMSELLQG